jgi:hypothetical protein
VKMCAEAGLVWGEELFIDATKVEANASMESRVPRFSAEAHLGGLFGDDEGRPGPKRKTKRRGLRPRPTS